MFFQQIPIIVCPIISSDDHDIVTYASDETLFINDDVDQNSPTVESQQTQNIRRKRGTPKKTKDMNIAYRTRQDFL